MPIVMSKACPRLVLLVATVAFRFSSGMVVPGCVDTKGNVWSIDFVSQRGGAYAVAQFSTLVETALEIGDVIPFSTGTSVVGSKGGGIHGYLGSRMPKKVARLNGSATSANVTVHSTSAPLGEEKVLVTYAIGVHGSAGLAASEMEATVFSSTRGLVVPHPMIQVGDDKWVGAAYLSGQSASARNIMATWTIPVARNAGLSAVTRRSPRASRVGVGKIWNGYYWENSPARIPDGKGGFKEIIGNVRNPSNSRWRPSDPQ